MYKYIPSPKELREALPLSFKQKSFIASSQKIAQDIITKKSSKKVVICGPCSIHNFSLFLDYAKRLKDISHHIKDKVFVVIRAYIEKPRTLPGFKGFVYQPNYNHKENLSLGLQKSRELFLALTDLEIPISMEILEPNLFNYFEDLLTWGFIGARTSSSQTHRQIASYANIPIGFKNTLEGNIELAIQGMNFSQSPQNFFQCNDNGQLAWIESLGNPYSHLVLRGSNHSTNYDLESLKKAFLIQKSYDINTSLMVDCSHGNSGKNPKKQKEVFLEMVKVLAQPEILGLMIESNHQEDSSVTDPCLDLETTRDLLLVAHQSLSQSLSTLAN